MMDSFTREDKSRIPKHTIKDKKVNLPEKVLDALQNIGEKYDLDQIILFGSRARCTNAERSDIDLALYAEDVKQYYEILDDLDEIETLLMFDVVDMNSSAFSNDLYEEIKRDGVVIYRKVKKDNAAIYMKKLKETEQL